MSVCSKFIVSMSVKEFWKFTTQFADERIFIIGEHSAKLQAKRLIVSHARLHSAFTLHFCTQRCSTRQISKISCVLRTETVTNCCYRQICWAYSLQISNCCRPVLIYWLTDWRHQRLTDYWLCTFAATSFSLLQQLCRGYDILYGWCKHLIDSELNNAYQRNVLQHF